MRAYLLSAAVVATLALTTPDAKAQIIAFPSINTSPYAYPGYVYPASYAYPAYSYSYPSYSYSYGYNYPGYTTYTYGWSNPYSTWNWAGYQTYPTYYPTYLGGYRGWRRW
ncbi:MAG: hypothetical protein JWO38_5761 [Gemmataceae bacterium]|nr:hypothetical protein [Gemmataceae bacterium]